MSLSIVIPSDSNSIARPKRSKQVCSQDDTDTLWRAAVYEIWNTKDIYIDLIMQIDLLFREFMYAIFSKRKVDMTPQQFFIKKILIQEGIFLLQKDLKPRRRKVIDHHYKKLIDIINIYTQGNQ